MAALGWVELEPKATTDGQTSVSWSLAQPVADADEGVVMVYRNGLSALPGEVSISEDGATVTYTPAAAFVAAESVWGRYVAEQVTALPQKTMHAGDTAVAWPLSRKAANLPDGTVTVYHNGVAVSAGISVASDGLSITYIPGAAFAEGDTVFGWYVSVADAAAVDTAKEGIIAAAMEVIRRRLGLDAEEWPDALLYAEAWAVLTLLTRQFDALSDLSALDGDDVNLLGLVVGLTTAWRIVSGLMFARSGGAQSIKGKETEVNYGGGRAIATIREDLTGSMKQEAERYFGMLPAIRAFRQDAAAARSPFKVGGSLRHTPPAPWVWWRHIFNDMFYLTFPAGYPVEGWGA